MLLRQSAYNVTQIRQNTQPMLLEIILSPSSIISSLK